MKKIILVFAVLVICLGTVFAQGQAEPQQYAMPAEVQMPMAGEPAQEKCFCDCNKDGLDDKEAQQGQPMDQGYAPMGQQMKADGMQGNPQEYMPMGQEMKEGNMEKSCEDKVAELQKYIEELKKIISENGLTAPEPSVSEKQKEEKEQQPPQEQQSGQTAQQGQQQPPQEQQSGQTAQQGQQQPPQDTQQQQEKFKEFFKKMFQFFQKSEEMKTQDTVNPE